MTANNIEGGPLDERIHLSIKEHRKKVNNNGESYKRMRATNRVKDAEQESTRKLKKKRISYVSFQVHHLI